MWAGVQKHKSHLYFGQIMSYSKKDEDADQAIVKVDRTAVFQEGTKTLSLVGRVLILFTHSALVQLFPYISAKMSNIVDQNCPTRLHWGVLPSKRSDRPFLRHFEAFPKQGPFTPPDDVPHIQRVGKFCVRCDHDDPKHHERYWSRKRRCVQGKRYPSIMQNYRREQGARRFE